MVFKDSPVVGLKLINQNDFETDGLEDQRLK
jgi:hypothetical protein